jgi:hypothetical protein
MVAWEIPAQTPLTSKFIQNALFFVLTAYVLNESAKYHQNLGTGNECKLLRLR